jgi:uncharacterized protein
MRIQDVFATRSRSAADVVTRRSKRVARLIAWSAVLATLVIALWAFWWEPRRLVVNEQTLKLPCWNADPLLLAVVSDLHVGAPGMGIDRLDQIVDAVNRSKADAVLLLGDFVIQGVVGGRFVAPEEIAQHLRRLQAPLGVHAVLGNHDWWLDGPRVRAAFESAGIPILDDTAISLRNGSSPFWLVGISDFWQKQYDLAATLAKVPDEKPIVMMTHNPDIFDGLSPRVCLTVAGHTHGGQVALPLIGRPVVPSRFGQRYAVGHIEERGQHLFVTSGVGTSIMPVRLGVPPEIVLLRLER